MAFEVVKKPLQFFDGATRQVKRASHGTKNEQMRDDDDLRYEPVKISLCADGELVCGAGQLQVYRPEKKHFIAVLKDNRLTALSEADKQKGRFVRIDSLLLPVC